MNTNLDGLSPREVWEKFAEIARVPRPSRHEEAIRAYLVAEARTHGIACTVDDAGNVILRKPATPGMESRKGIILQAHMDMVPQKNGDKRFDFTKDPIEVRVDGEWVRADGTTLGADNGIGVAAILAVMESEDVVHGPLEALITATEETGMDGARGLKGGMLDGEILVNLDSETEGELYVGCAGGLDASVRMTYREDIVPEGYKAFWIAVGGLKGGHSGIDIHLGRGNANRILFRLLRKCERECGLRLASVDGGGLRNAIPREATATVGRFSDAGRRSRIGVERGVPGRRRCGDRSDYGCPAARFADRPAIATAIDPGRTRMSRRRNPDESVDAGAGTDFVQPGPGHRRKRGDSGALPVTQLAR